MPPYLKLINKSNRYQYKHTAWGNHQEKVKQKLFKVNDSWQVGVGQNTFVRRHPTVRFKCVHLWYVNYTSTKLIKPNMVALADEKPF